MKKNKTIFTVLIAVFLGIVSLGMNSSPVKATNNVKLYLNSNSYVYNNKGQRLRGKINYLKKNKDRIQPVPMLCVGSSIGEMLVMPGM